MILPYPVLDVSTASREFVEPMGTKKKFWFIDDAGTRWLFKYSRAGTGEHWSEKVAAEVGKLLDIPCALVELGTCDESPGACSRLFLPAGTALVHGNELLQQVDDTYPTTQLRGVSKHTVSAVLDRLGSIEPPDKSPASLNATDCFVGYLLLDAVIGNVDRHHENWAVIQAPEHRRLAPSYDHASSLGRELQDAERAARLDGADGRRTVETYAQRATSAFYSTATDTRPLSPIDAFRTAAAMLPEAASFWLARLAAVGQNAVEDIVQAVPSTLISDLSRRFALAVVACSRGRLLGGGR